jgi:TonB-linked SusC/RagA family outer membrane protein
MKQIKDLKRRERTQESRLNLLNWRKLALLLTFFFSLSAFAQQAALLKGVVTDGKEPLPGVKVKVDGKNLGSSTDLDGNFRLNGLTPGEEVTVIVNMIGFKDKYITLTPVGGENDLGTIVLESEAKDFEEVVVTAFGVSKEKRDLGYSTQSIDGAELLKARQPNPIEGLTGKIAGLNIGTNAEMMGAPNVELRGETGLMYVVDGVPINSDTWNISPDDIETYTVLKGPNAAALYGFRGQNGAILITTKQGSNSEKGWHVDYNSSLQANATFLTRPPSQAEYAVGNNFQYAFGNDPLDQDGNFRRAAIWGPRMEGQLVPQWDSPVDENGIRQGTPLEVKGENNLENFIQTGFLTVNNLNMGVSNNTTDFRMSLTSQYQRGIWPNTGININNIQMSGGHNLSPRLKVRGMVNMNMQSSDNIPDANYGPNSYAYDFGVYAGAWFDIRDLEDYWMIEGVQQLNREYGRTNNPWFIANEWLRSHHKNDMYGFASVSYEINEYSAIQLRTQATMWDAIRTEKRPYSAEIYFRPNRAGDYAEDRRNLFESNNDLLYTYERDLGDFHISGLVGGTIRDFSYHSSYTTTNDLVVPGIYNFTNSANPVYSMDFESKMLVLSGYSSIDFGYKNFFRINGTGHWDKLSTLPVGEQNYFYPSASISTVPTRYMRDVIPKAISFLKFRGSVAEVQGGLVNNMVGPSYAALGMGHPISDFIGGPWFTSYDGPSYQNQNLYSTSPVYNNQPGASYTSVIANPELQPFTVRAFETGFDMMFLKNRLGFDFTYFQTLNGPQIFVRDLAPSSGYDQTNINDVVTKKNGFELVLKGTPVLNKDFRWNILANYASFIERFHEINDPSGTIFLNGNFFEVGDRVDEIYDVQFIRDPSGNIIHGPDGLPLRPQGGPEGMTFVGHGRPDFVWGLTNQFSYKNWSFSFQFDGRFGGVFFNNMKSVMYQGGTHMDLVEGDLGAARLAEWESFKENGSVTPGYVSEGVQIVDGTIQFNDDGTVANYDDLTFEPNSTPTRVQSYALHLTGFGEPWYQSRSYGMLRDVRITYNFPQKWLEKTKIEHMSISLVGRNLLYFAQGKEMNMDQYTGFDKQNFMDRSTNNPSLQSATVRSFGFNLNVRF